MSLPLASVVTMPGREVLAATIARLKDRAAYGREAAAAYGAEHCPEVLLDAQLWDGLATALQVIKSRAEIRLEDRPTGKSSFASSVKHDCDQDIAKIVSGALRAAFASERPGMEAEKNAA